MAYMSQFRCLMLAGVVGFGAAVSVDGLGQIPSAWEAFQRQQKFEVYGLAQYLHSKDIDFHGPYGPVRLEMQDTGLGGFGLAYHLNDFLAVRGDFMFGPARFKPVDSGGGPVPLGLARDAVLHTFRLNLDYNVINRRFTPLLTAGIGYQYLWAELVRHPSVTVCWWDPWWGTICGTGRPTYDELDFTWNVGAGFRWNVTDHFFVKAMGGLNWLQYDEADDLTRQVEGIFGIGWTF
jgi:opacity protein-like surface antigen